jgi:queuine tRNA-ribosyltransferase
VVETPVFIPVGTQGVVKSLTSEDLSRIGVEVILANAYHLYLQPGLDVVRECGGLHRFIGWEKPILTDSGGFQIYSLGVLAKVKEEGAYFKSHLDGSSHFLSPELMIDVQRSLGADIIITLDHCLAYPSDRQTITEAMRLSSRWAKRSFDEWKRLDDDRQLLFGISQGGVYQDLRKESAEELMKVDFPGYAVGGLSVGEPKEQMYRVIELLSLIFPGDKPRYIMGLGAFEDLFQAIACGYDMFDCVLPTRNARNGCLFTSRGRLVIKHSKYSRDTRPIDEDCNCYTCRNFSRAYLRHLFTAKEITFPVLATYHNLYFYLDTFRKIRQAIVKGKFADYRERFLKRFNQGD